MRQLFPVFTLPRSYKVCSVGRPYLVDKRFDYSLDRPPGLGGAKEFSPTARQLAGLRWHLAAREEWKGWD